MTQNSDDQAKSSQRFAEKCRKALEQSYGVDFKVPKSVQQCQKVKEESN
jgi:hypothetical protein